MSTTNISEFEVMKRLGEGSFGSVYMVKRKSDEKIYAMKKVKMLSLSTKEKENALNEVRILASIKSANIISYKDAFYDEGSSSLCIIMDFASKGDVLMQITEKKKKKAYFDEATVWKYAADMLLGLKALHDLKILHRDLKGANVFISEEGSLKLGDLNVSKVQKRDYAHTQTGTPYYTSPEVWQNRPYDSKCDVWSLGCVLYEIITLEPPFKGTSMEDLYKKVLRGVFTPIDMKRYSSDLQRFVENCLRVDPKSRSSVDSLLTHKNILPHIDLDTIAANDRNRNKNAPPDLLQTIKLPYGGLKGLNKHLPKSNYEKDIPEEPEEVKSDQIHSKKSNDNRPFSANHNQQVMQQQQPPQQVSSAIPAKKVYTENSNNNNNMQAGQIFSRPRDPSLHKEQVPAAQYYSPSYGHPNQPSSRQHSAQPQVKRVLSSNDISSNQGRHYMPPLISPIGQSKQILNNPPSYMMNPSQNHPYNQPRISVHQEKDTGYNQPMPIRRNLSRDNIQMRGNNLPPPPPSMMKRPEDYPENNRNYGNQRPLSGNNQQYYMAPSPGSNGRKVNNPAGMPPAGRISNSISQPGLPPRYKNY